MFFSLKPRSHACVPALPRSACLELVHIENMLNKGNPVSIDIGVSSNSENQLSLKFQALQHYSDDVSVVFGVVPSNGASAEKSPINQLDSFAS